MTQDSSAFLDAAWQAADAAGEIIRANWQKPKSIDYKGAIDFYGAKMGFRQAFAFQEPDGSPYLTYFQINRDTFVEVMQATPARPVGCPHFGLEVEHLDSAVEQLRRRGVEVRAPSLSPRTGSRIALATAPGGVNIELLEFGATSLHPKVIDAWK